MERRELPRYPVIDIVATGRNIRRLRLKIEDDAQEPRYIATVWGTGYKWSTD